MQTFVGFNISSPSHVMALLPSFRVSTKAPPMSLAPFCVLPVPSRKPGLSLRPSLTSHLQTTTTWPFEPMISFLVTESPSTTMSLPIPVVKPTRTGRNQNLKCTMAVQSLLIMPPVWSTYPIRSLYGSATASSPSVSSSDGLVIITCLVSKPIEQTICPSTQPPSARTSISMINISILAEWVLISKTV